MAVDPTRRFAVPLPSACAAVAALVLLFGAGARAHTELGPEAQAAFDAAAAA